MPNVPMTCRVTDRNVVILGGGSVAVRRAKTFSQAGALVTVIAPEYDAQLDSMPNVTVMQREYIPGDLEGAFLVVIATDSPEVNEHASEDAKALKVLVNRTDSPDEGDITIPAHASSEPLTITIDTDGISARAAARIRDELLMHLDEDWLRLLKIARGYRTQIQETITDAKVRQPLLRKLASDEAMEQLKYGGEQQLEYWYDQQIESTIGK